MKKDKSKGVLTPGGKQRAEIKSNSSLGRLKERTKINTDIERSLSMGSQGSGDVSGIQINVVQDKLDFKPIYAKVAEEVKEADALMREEL